MKYTLFVAASAMSLAGAADSDAKFADFDIKHLSFGTDPHMRAFKASLLAAKAQAEQLATTASTDGVDATAEVSTATTSAERRLRGVGHFAAASFWDAVSADFNSVWSQTVNIFSPPPAEVSIDNSTQPIFEPLFTDAPTLGPTASVNVKKAVKPIKRARKFFETMFYGGENQCRIKHNTYFESHTWGVTACFESSLSNQDERVYTSSTYVKGLGLENKDAEEYTVTTRFFSDIACQKEWTNEDHKGYLPIIDSLATSCDEVMEEERFLVGSKDAFKKVSKISNLWELSHAPHRETGGHEMSISLYSKGSDCIDGQSDETGKFSTLQERYTVSYGTKTCIQSDSGYSYIFKCLMNNEISVRAFANNDCSGEEYGPIIVTREQSCASKWSGIYTSGYPVVQCGVGENWESTVEPEDIDYNYN